MNIITFPTGNVGIGTETPNSTLEIAGTLRLTGSTGIGETLMGRNNLGDVSAITIGSGLSLSANTLTSTGGGGGGISGTGTTNYIPKWGSGTSLANSVIFQSGTSVGIGTTTLSSDRLDIQGTTASEGGQIGAELATTGTLGAGWAGTSFATGYLKASGTASNITTTLAAVIGSPYQVSYTITAWSGGTVAISIGGITSGNVSVSGTLPQTLATSTATLLVAASSGFTGNVVVSVKQITASTMATFALKNSSGTVVYEQRAGTSNTNIFQGVGAGRLNTTGINNVFQGYLAGNSNTTGDGNVFLGSQAGNANTTGDNNFFQGNSTGTANTTGLGNLFIGTQAGTSNTTGNYNSFFGYQSGRFNTSASYNMFIGGNSGYFNSTGGRNIAIGYESGYQNSTTANNISIGYNASKNATAAGNNVVIGNDAALLNEAGANLTGFTNSALIGFGIRLLNVGDVNSTVIGYNGRGLGSNTTVIGNSTTTRAKLWGSFENQSSSASNANTSLLIQNSATRALLTVKDGGVIEIGANVTVTGNTTATIQATDSAANVGIALAPKGSGAFTLSIPDGTSSGGNLRGAYAVDLQTSRSLATQIAGGQYSVIGGGNSNVTSEYYSGSVIAGGGNNTIIKDLSVISGGGSNIINSSAGVISGGENNILESNANYASVVGGKQGIAYLYGQTSRASGALATQGDAQTSEFIVRRIVTGTGVTELFLDGVSLRAKLDYGSTTNRLWNLVANTSAMVLSGDTEPLSKGHSWVHVKLAGIKKVNTTTSLVGSPSNFETLYDGGMSGSSISLTADNTNDALIVQFTPPLTATAATVIYVVTTIKITEVGFN